MQLELIREIHPGVQNVLTDKQLKRKKGENDKHKDIEHLSLMMVLCIESELLASSQVMKQHPPLTAV